MITRNSIIEKCPNLVEVDHGENNAHKALKMNNHDLPISISEKEINYLINYIDRNQLKIGFDLATAFGISALAISLGVQKNNGYVLSMDSYLEEQNQKMPYGTTTLNPNWQESDGYKTANYIKNSFQLDHLTLKAGVNPVDTFGILKDFTDQYGKIDIAVIDCPKDDNDFIATWEILYKFLNDKFAVFVHDTHAFNGAALTHLQNKYNLSWFNVQPEEKYPFVVIERNI
jgi:hypothetical protein